MVVLNMVSWADAMPSLFPVIENAANEVERVDAEEEVEEKEEEEEEDEEEEEEVEVVESFLSTLWLKSAEAEAAPQNNPPLHGLLRSTDLPLAGVCPLRGLAPLRDLTPAGDDDEDDDADDDVDDDDDDDVESPSFRLVKLKSFSAPLVGIMNGLKPELTFIDAENS